MHTNNADVLAALDNINYFSGVSGLAQAYISSVISDQNHAFLERFKDRNRRALRRSAHLCCKLLNALGVPYVEPDAGLFIFANFGKICPTAAHSWEGERRLVLELAQECKIVVSPGELCHAKDLVGCCAFVLHGLMKISFGRHSDEFETTLG